MSFSDVDICNIALSRLGERNRIQSLDSAADNTTAAVLCRENYALARDCVLEAAPWDFALVRTFALALVATDEEAAWKFIYARPADAAHLLNADDGTTGVRYELQQPYVTGLREGQLVIYSNVQDLKLNYIARATDPSKWSGLFVNALAWRLASDLALPLTRQQKLQTLASAQYEQAIAEALAHTLNEDQPPVPPEGSIAGSRR